MTSTFPRLYLLFSAVLVCFPLVGRAFSIYESHDFSLHLKGYYKNLFVYSKSRPTDSHFSADLNRIRTEWDAAFFKILSTKVIWDNEIIAGDFVHTAEFALRQSQRSEPYLDMDYEIVKKNNFYYGQQFYRAYAQIDPGLFVLTLGRQKIDWGVMRLFSPVDLFTRLPIFDIEKEERVGTTGANLVIPVGRSLQINPVYSFNPDFDRSRIAGRITQTVGRFDLSVLGGKFLEDEVFGFDFTGDIRKMGVRGEFIYDRAEFADDFAQFAVGVDYGFENSLTLALEYFYNGLGTNDVTTFTPSPLIGVQIQTAHKNFISLDWKYDLTPLWKIFMETVVDLNGGSVFLYPMTEYSALEWLVFAAGVQIPVGQEGGEFTAVPNSYFAQAQAFF